MQGWLFHMKLGYPITWKFAFQIFSEDSSLISRVRPGHAVASKSSETSEINALCHRMCQRATVTSSQRQLLVSIGHPE